MTEILLMLKLVVITSPNITYSKMKIEPRSSEIPIKYVFNKTAVSSSLLKICRKSEALVCRCQIKNYSEILSKLNE